MKRGLCILLMLVLALGIVGVRAEAASDFHLEALEESPYYRYDAIEKLWMLCYSSIDEGGNTGLSFSAYGSKDGTLKMPIVIQGVCHGYYANQIAVVIGDQVHRISVDDALKSAKSFYVFKNTEPLLAAMKDADEITVRTYAGSDCVTFTIGADDYAPMKAYINTLYESGVIDLCVNMEDSGLSSFYTYTVE